MRQSCCTPMRQESNLLWHQRSTKRKMKIVIDQLITTDEPSDVSTPAIPQSDHDLLRHPTAAVESGVKQVMNCAKWTLSISIFSSHVTTQGSLQLLCHEMRFFSCINCWMFGHSVMPHLKANLKGSKMAHGFMTQIPAVDA